MKQKTKSHEKSDPGFDANTFRRHYVATVDTDQDWSQERPQQGRGSNRLFLFLLLFHIFLIGSVVLYNLVSERPKPVFVDNSAPPKTTAPTTKKSPTAEKQSPASNVVMATKGPEIVDHRVVQGDSMKSIAAASDVTQEEIARMNQIDVNTQLAVGSVLRVPQPKVRPSPSVIPVGVQPSRVEEKVVTVHATTAAANASMFAAVTPAPTPKVSEPAPAPRKTETVAIKLPEEKPKPKSIIEDSPPPAIKPRVAERVEESPPAPKPKPTESKAVARVETPPAPTAKPAATPKANESAKSATSKPAASAKPVASTTTHTVKPKETFYSISRKYGVKAEDLMRVNGVTDPGKLREGVVLKVPK